MRFRFVDVFEYLMPEELICNLCQPEVSNVKISIHNSTHQVSTMLRGEINEGLLININ